MKFPALFLGHGSPMNAMQDNAFTKFLSNLGRELGKPKGIAVISAHWQTIGTCVASQTQLKQIYDFYEFPQELYNINYNPPGSPQLANEIISNSDCMITANDSWGLDHGSWVLLKHMYPMADVPVIQISLDQNKRPREHFDTGKKLRFLREQDVLVIGSGNIIHNLMDIHFGMYDAAYEWATEFNTIFKEKIRNEEYNALIDYHLLGKNSKLAVPTEEHYLPLLYILGMLGENEKCKIIFDEIQYGSVSMLCLQTGD